MFAAIAAAAAQENVWCGLTDSIDAPIRRARGSRIITEDLIINCGTGVTTLVEYALAMALCAATKCKAVRRFMSIHPLS